MAGITIYVYLEGRPRQPVPVANCTSVDFAAALDDYTGDWHRYTWVGGTQLLAGSGLAPTNHYVTPVVALPATFAATGGGLLSAVSDDVGGFAPTPTKTKRDRIVFTTDPAVTGSKCWAWADEVIGVSNCDPNNIPAGAVGYVYLEGQRQGIPVTGLNSTADTPITVYLGDTIRNLAPAQQGTLPNLGGTGDSQFVTQLVPLVSPVAPTDNLSVPVPDNFARIPPQPVASKRYQAVLSVSTASVGGTPGLFFWRDRVQMISNASS